MLLYATMDGKVPLLLYAAADDCMICQYRSRPIDIDNNATVCCPRLAEHMARKSVAGLWAPHSNRRAPPGLFLTRLTPETLNLAPCFNARASDGADGTVN